MAKRNKRRGSSFNNFLREQGMYKEVQSAAVRRAVAEEIEDGTQKARISKDVITKRVHGRNRL